MTNPTTDKHGAGKTRPPKFKIGDRVKRCDYEGLTDLGEVMLVRPAKMYGYQYKMTDGLWWHESHLSLDVPNEPKFKVGDRVKFKNALDTDVVERFRDDEPNGPYYELVSRFGQWHESLLSLDVPEAKKYATDLESRLGAEIIKQHRAITDLSNRLTEEIGGRHRERFAKESAQKELAAAHEEIERMRRIGNERGAACTQLSNRLAEEIDGRARERIAKEEAEKRIEGYVAELCEVKRKLKIADGTLERAFAQFPKDMAAERQAKEAVQQQLADVRQDLADLHKDLADLRIISKRLAL